MVLDKFIERLSLREKIGMLAAVTAIFIAIVNGFVVGRIVSRLAELDSSIRKERQSLAINHARIRNKVTAEYDSILRLLGRTSSPEETMNSMKDTVTEIAKKTGIDLPSMEDKDPAKKDNYEEYAVEVSKFETDIQTLLKFLAEIQNSTDMLRVTKLSIAPGKDGVSVKGSMLITKMMIVGEDEVSDKQ